ncbi:MAG: sugar-binding protein [Clostridiales Family XIII bacterium]|jgi:putative multiple sugar transport system substrate-binding protein|nr:sugar-binding protein [Clostridiales Family XIII bacterium]
MKKKVFSILLVIAMVFTFSACGQTGGNDGDDADTGNGGGDTLKVGVSMPTQSLQRWNQDGANMKQQLEAAGYEVDLQYAGDNDVPTQVAQLENMIATGCQVLVIAAIEAASLTNVVDSAKAAGIPVIAYDRLIMNTDGIAYYATFDNNLVGRMQGEYIETALDLKNSAGPYNIEMFTGSPDDNNIIFFFGGALEVLQPYIDEGKLVVPSGQTAREQCAIQGWSSEVAQSRMENLIAVNGYGPNGTKLDAVLCSNDSTAQGVTTALKNAGYTAENFPIITGQDCDKPSVINMKQGTQSMSVFKDTRTLAARTVQMIDSILKGTEPEINDTTTYDNGTGVIPTYQCAPVIGTIENYQELLIDSGYYTEADVTPAE